MGNANNPGVKSSIIENQKQSTNALAAFIRKEFEKFETLINPERWIDRQLVRIARKKQSWRYVLCVLAVWSFITLMARSVIMARFFGG